MTRKKIKIRRRVILITKSNQGNTKGILFLVNLIQKPLLVSTYNFGFLYVFYVHIVLPLH